LLVLTRKQGQSIRIGDDIIIKIVDIDGSQVKIGIEAPKGVLIFREELYEKLRESNIEALKTSKELKPEDIIKEYDNDKS
jgi:carbon storage regulator